LQKSSQDIFLPKDPKALARALDRLSDKQLTQAPGVEPVLIERLGRKGVDLNARSSALDELAKLHQTDRVSEAIAALQRLDTGGGTASTGADLGMLLPIRRRISQGTFRWPGSPKMRRKPQCAAPGGARSLPRTARCVRRHAEESRRAR
jgi:hypothetical protein